MLNSIDRDGTGFGLDLNLLKFVKDLKKPLIISGGLGKREHFYQGFKNNNIDAISTANILNFLGSALYDVRMFLLSKKINMPKWNKNFL